MAVNGQATDITLADIKMVAERFSVPDASQIIERVLGSVMRWPDIAREVGVAQDGIDKVATHIDVWSQLLRPMRVG